MIPNLDLSSGRGMGDIKSVKGGKIPVPVEQVEEMIRLLIDSLPSIIHK